MIFIYEVGLKLNACTDACANAAKRGTSGRFGSEKSDPGQRSAQKEARFTEEIEPSMGACQLARRQRASCENRKDNCEI